MNDIVPSGSEFDSSTSGLVKQGLRALGFTAGGLFLFALQALARFRVFGLVFGAVVCAAGIASLLSKNPENRRPGALITAAGALVILSKAGIPLIQTAAGTLLGIGALGLVAAGVWNGIKFFKGLKKRS